MNNNEFLDKLNGYLAQINELAEKANALAEEYNHSEQAEDKNPKDYTLELLKDYVEAFKNPMYWIEFGEICHGSLAGGEDDIFAFENFPTGEYIKKLRKMNRLNGMMLAFKWCYDRDYEPDWADNSSYKYTIIWNKAFNRFDYSWSTITICNHVYFSSDTIAKKCADWLNKIAESEDLI